MLDTPFVMIAKALADPTRHQMLRELRGAGEMTCSDVCERFALSQPTISHHIRTLAEAGVIEVRKEGPYHVLSVNEERMRAFAADLLPRGRGKPAEGSSRSRAKRGTSKARRRSVAG
ncbi:MAG: ArsR/SmtB family transcription factor [Phycisphaerales bacterium]